MAILVTGCAGYIGAIACKLLLEAGYQVIGIDDLSRSKPSHLVDGIEFYQACISDEKILEEIVGKHNRHHAKRSFASDVDTQNVGTARNARVAFGDNSDFQNKSNIEAVMHFAAFIEVAESVEKPGLYKENNYIKTTVLVDKLINLGIKNLIFSSTAAVYGLPIMDIALKEDSELMPINPYGENKLAVEKYLELKSQEEDFKYIALRYFNVAGAYGDIGEEHEPESHIIPIALDALLGHREIFKLFGTDYNTADGTAVRDYIHVVDLCKAHIAALDLFKSGKGINQAYNLGYNKGFSVLEIVRSIEKMAGQAIPLEYSDRRAGDPDRLVADNTKAIAAGFFKPERASIDRIIEDALEHRKKFHANR